MPTNPFRSTELRMTISLRQRTLDLLKARPEGLKLRQIADDTGLNEKWVYSFNAGTYKNPSVVKVQKLYEYLSGEVLLSE